LGAVDDVAAGGVEVAGVAAAGGGKLGDGADGSGGVDSDGDNDEDASRRGLVGAACARARVRDCSIWAS
jgi:hypothetical protein